MTSFTLLVFPSVRLDPPRVALVAPLLRGLFPLLPAPWDGSEVRVWVATSEDMIIGCEFGKNLARDRHNFER